jgi:hypothetical protein
MTNEEKRGLIKSLKLNDSSVKLRPDSVYLRKEGDNVTGVYLGLGRQIPLEPRQAKKGETQEQQFLQLHVFRVAGGKNVAVAPGASFQTMLAEDEIRVGDILSITYMGQIDIKDSKRMNVYDIERYGRLPQSVVEPLNAAQTESSKEDMFLTAVDLADAGIYVDPETHETIDAVHPRVAEELKAMYRGIEKGVDNDTKKKSK